MIARARRPFWRPSARSVGGAPALHSRCKAPVATGNRLARAARLMHAGDVQSAVQIVFEALTAAPPGNSGWHLSVEPLRRVGQDRDAWGPALALLPCSRADSVYSINGGCRVRAAASDSSNPRHSVICRESVPAYFATLVIRSASRRGPPSPSLRPWSRTSAMAASPPM